MKVKKVKKIKKEKILFFTRELRVMLKSGITFSDALNILYSQEKDKYLKYILGKILKSITSGKTIFESYKPFDYIFGDNYIYMLKIGEKSGSLTQRLEDIAKDLEFNIQNQKKISSMLIYPITVLIFTVSIISFLILNILPSFIDIFEENNVEIPLATKILLSISDNFMVILGMIILGIVSLIFLVRYVNKNKNLKYKKDKMLFQIPLLRVFFKYSFSINFYRTFSVLLSTGINMDEILEILYKNNNNLFIKSKMLRLKTSIISGSNVSEAIKYIDFFEDRFFNLVVSGEKSNSLSENLFFISEVLKQDLEYHTKKILTILEPLIMLFLGFIIGFIIIAIYLPIISINNIF